MKDSKINYFFILTFIAGMIVGAIVFSCPASAQVSFTPTLSGAASKEFRWTLGAELQADNISVIGGWSPLKIKGVQSDGFTFGMVGYLYPYQTSPYLEFKMVTNGKANLSEITGMAVRSTIVMIGLRVFPIELNDNIIDRLSFNLGIGIDIKENTATYLHGEVAAKFTLFKFQ